jgi:hypothetical protein
MLLNRASTPDRALTHIEKVGRVRLSSNRQICRLLGDTIAAMRQRRQPSGNHSALAFVEVPALEVRQLANVPRLIRPHWQSSICRRPSPLVQGASVLSVQVPCDCKDARANDCDEERRRVVADQKVEYPFHGINFTGALRLAGVANAPAATWIYRRGARARPSEREQAAPPKTRR